MEESENMILKEGQKLITAFLNENLTEKKRSPSRLDLLRYSVLEAKKPGLFLEFGVLKGYSLNFLAKCKPNQQFYGFDCFKGLPETWGNIPKGYGKLDYIPYVPENVILIEGLFQDTLEPFLEDHNDSVSFLHLDADLYSSTKYVLSTLANAGRIQKGTIIEFDEIFFQDSSNTVLDDEYRAYKDFMRDYDVKVRWIQFYQRKINERWLFFRRIVMKSTIRASLVIEKI